MKDEDSAPVTAPAGAAMPSASGLRPAAVFLDRDGVLNRPVVREGRPYPPGTVGEFVLYPDAAPACARLAAAGFVLVVVTNQPDVGRGTQTLAAVGAMHARLRAELPQIARVEVCPHGGADHGQPCACRKPRPGMVQRAAAALGLDVARSWLVGDRWRDVDCGRAAGCRTVFIERGYAEALRGAPDFRVGSLAGAVAVILEQHAAGRAAENGLPRPAPPR